MFLVVFFLLAGNFAGGGQAQTFPSDAQAMRALAESLNGDITLGWKMSVDPCSWPSVSCSGNRVVGIQIGNRKVAGKLTTGLRNLTALVHLELHGNQISGPLFSLSGLSSLQTLLLHGNLFSFIPPDFFSGMTTLQSVSLDYNPFEPWEIPSSLKDSSSLVRFSANSANVTGEIPEFLGSSFPSLSHLGLAYNLLHGPIPSSFSSSTVQTLWLNNQRGYSRLSGPISVIQNMSSLTQLWLQSNDFSGYLPDFSSLVDLQDLSLRDNRFTGTVPVSLLHLPSLKKVTLANNLFQGPIPEFPVTVTVELTTERGSFCRTVPGDCDPRVNSLLFVAKSLGFPRVFAESWKGNNPCSSWLGISCNAAGDVTIINFKGMGLSGEISSAFSSLLSLQKLWLSNNNLTGSIPSSLASLPNLRDLDLSNNSLTGSVPSFPSSVLLNTTGNPALGKETFDSNGSGHGSSSTSSSIPVNSSPSRSSGSTGVIVVSVLGVLFVVTLILLVTLVLIKMKKKKKRSCGKVQSTTVVAPAVTNDPPASDPGNMQISMQVLRQVTGDFSSQNILGSGGFGTVYRGELHDGTKIAVKRMESGALTSKGMSEFKSEISVLTKLRHRNLVSLRGYCLEGNERVLVYEFMPLGTLSQHLFDWEKLELEPLTWGARVSIALDVARAVEYLHSLAHQSFIHRDLKPSNILLGEGFRAKVSDFGLVRLAPADGKSSVETRLAGTFGYLAPEYAGKFWN